MIEKQPQVADKPEPSSEPSASGATGPSETLIEPPAEPGGARMDLPKWNRARVKRKAPAGEEQDAFQESVRRAGRTTVRRAPIVVAALVVVAAAVGGVIYGLERTEERRAQATRLLATAAAYEARGQVGPIPETYFNRPSPSPIEESAETLAAKAQGALSDLEKELPDSRANLLAELVRGARALEAGDPAAAETAYRAFLERAAGHELAFLAREGLGVALEAGGKKEEALAVYDELAAAERSFYRDQALAHKGRVLEGLGRRQEAIEVYRQYVQEYPRAPSLGRDFVTDRLEELDPESVPQENSSFQLPEGGLDVVDSAEPGRGEEEP